MYKTRDTQALHQTYNRGIDIMLVQPRNRLRLGDTSEFTEVASTFTFYPRFSHAINWCTAGKRSQCVQHSFVTFLWIIMDRISSTSTSNNQSFILVPHVSLTALSPKTPGKCNDGQQKYKQNLRLHEEGYMQICVRVPSGHHHMLAKRHPMQKTKLLSSNSKVAIILNRPSADPAD